MEVSVVLVTYNHERYIAQAIESVLAQETDFPFELLIAGGVIGWVALSNVRGISARGLEGRVLRLGILMLTLFILGALIEALADRLAAGRPATQAAGSTP